MRFYFHKAIKESLKCLKIFSTSLAPYRNSPECVKKSIIAFFWSTQDSVSCTKLYALWEWTFLWCPSNK